MADSLWAPEMPPRRREEWVLDCEVQTCKAEMGQMQLDDLYCRIYQFGQYNRPRSAGWFGNDWPVRDQFNFN